MSFISYSLRSRFGFYLPGCTLFLILFASISAFAQNPPAPQERPRRALPTEPDAPDIIKVDTDLVPLDVVATDAKGRLVRNLKKEDFKLYEDGIERPIASFNLEKIEGARAPWRLSSRLTSPAA